MNPVQVGFWVPNKRWATSRYIKPLHAYVLSKKKSKSLYPVSPAIRIFKRFIESNSVIRMLVTSMITQSNLYSLSRDGKEQKEILGVGDDLMLGSMELFFLTLNEIINTSPGFNDTEMVGVPMSAYLAIGMGTQPGIALFLNEDFNMEVKKLLDAWHKFLGSPASLDKLDIRDPEKPGSWISKKAFKAGVWADMEYNKNLPGFGFTSWNAFFSRTLKPGSRKFFGDESKVINIGCETTPWQYSNNLKLVTSFWIKDVNYSLVDLFGGKMEIARLFTGGQLYQGFLSATHYHRWNSPLTGEVICSWREQGTYFSQRPGQPETKLSYAGMVQQPYLGHVATRAIFLMHHKKIGYVALICVGMGEVSTVNIRPKYLVKPGKKPVAVERGDEIGRFEFGGSTHIMIFQKDTVELVDWAKNASKKRNIPTPIKLGTIIAKSKIR